MSGRGGSDEWPPDARGDGGGEEMSCGGNVDVLITIFYVNYGTASSIPLAA